MPENDRENSGSEPIFFEGNITMNAKKLAVCGVLLVSILAGCGIVDDDNDQPGNSVGIEDQDDRIDLDDELDDGNGSGITIGVDDQGNVIVDYGENTNMIDNTKVNRDDYWEGDTFHLDDYAAALGYTHLEGTKRFSFQFREDGGVVTSYITISIAPNSSSIQYHDDVSGDEGELSYMYHGDHSGQTANIEFDDDIWYTDEHNSIESHIDAFDHFAYIASDALDWNGLSNWD